MTGKKSVSPQAMTAAEAAALLSASSGLRIAPETIEAHVAAGAPVNAAGQINLLHYMAWLIVRQK